MEIGRKIKCLVWDLDHTLWNGVLLEDDNVALREGAVEVVRTLDQRGILQSVASRNDYDLAMARLKDMQLDEYFIYPQINWGAKSVSVQTIAESINIGMDSLAFIDDQLFEREEVSSVHPQVLCLDAADLQRIIELPAMMPRFITDDSRRRRQMYQADIIRKQEEDKFEGPQESFLASLGMCLRIAPAQKEDLVRAEELTVRTHQLNTTGYTYSYEELDLFMSSDQHHLWIVDLEDKYGTYGKIGLVLIETNDREWWIRLLLMSCRVMNRGVGSILINYIRNKAREAGVRLLAEMRLNSRNRIMYMTYKFNHFMETDKSEDRVVFENDLGPVITYPRYVTLELG